MRQTDFIRNIVIIINKVLKSYQEICYDLSIITYTFNYINTNLLRRLKLQQIKNIPTLLNKTTLFLFLENNEKETYSCNNYNNFLNFIELMPQFIL